MNEHLKLAYDWGCQAAMEKWAASPEWVARLTRKGMLSRTREALSKAEAAAVGLPGDAPSPMRQIFDDMHMRFGRAEGRGGLAARKLRQDLAMLGHREPLSARDLAALPGPQAEEYQRLNRALHNRQIQQGALLELKPSKPFELLDPEYLAQRADSWL